MPIIIPADSILATGDSISVPMFGKAVTFQVTFALPSYSDQIKSLYPPNFPTVFNGAIGGTTSADGLLTLPNLIIWNPLPKICIIAFGTNDAGHGLTPASFRTNMQAMIALALAAGKTPVIPTIPYSSAGGNYANIPNFNAVITGTLYGMAGVRAGPDLYAYFLANPGNLQGDGIHPTQAGYAAAILLYAQSMSWRYP